jgi:hypothetical protein
MGGLGFGQGYFGQYATGGSQPVEFSLDLHESSTAYLMPERTSDPLMAERDTDTLMPTRTTEAL